MSHNQGDADAPSAIDHRPAGPGLRRAGGVRGRAAARDASSDTRPGRRPRDQYTSRHDAASLAAPTLTPGRGGTLVPPRVHEVRPAEAAPGQDVRVIGSGGFVKLANGGYDESSRDFPLLFDGQPLGKLSCYVNRCEGALTVPANATPGPHLITSEYGAITVTVG